MKKLTTLLFAMIIGIVFANAQGGPIGKGGKQLNAGVGFSGWGIPVYVGMDFGVHPDFTLGFEFNYRSYDDNLDKHDYKHTIWGFFGNGNYHFNKILSIPSPWDVYAGLNVGFYHWSYDNDWHDDWDKGSRSSGLGLGLQLGARYYFGNLGINLEFGGGTASGGKIGITYKF